MDNKQKRERSSNFSVEETNLLLSLIEAKTSIIENKKSDATIWQDKEKAWKDIEKAFNSASDSVYRDHKHLKLKYEAIKRDTRKKVKSMLLFSIDESESPFDSDLVLPRTSPSIVNLMPAEEHNALPPSDLSHLSQDSSKNVLIIEEEDSKPPKKKVCVESQDKTLLQSKPKENRLFARLTEEKLEIAKIKKKLVTEELEQKLIQRKLLEKELEHKEIIYELEKQSQLLKIKIFKKELEKHMKQ